MGTLLARQRGQVLSFAEDLRWGERQVDESGAGVQILLCHEMMRQVEKCVAEECAGMVRNLARDAEFANLPRPLAQRQGTAISDRPVVRESTEFVRQLFAVPADIDPDLFQMNPRRSGACPNSKA